MMAGEIGAPVIIAKEIEVPATLVGRDMNFVLGIPEHTPGRHDDLLDTPPSDSKPDLPILYRQTHFNKSLEIAIASVYKPRPHHSRPLPSNQIRYTKYGSQKSVFDAQDHT
jgi:hypothetical protein